MFRSARPFLIVISVVVAVAVATTGAVVVANDKDNKCTAVAKDSKSPVARACAEGGFVAARLRMKTMVKSAKKKGVAFECGDCHQPEDYSVLKKDARENFKKLLATATF